MSPPGPLVWVKLDEDLGESHAELVRRAGYDADRAGTTIDPGPDGR